MIKLIAQKKTFGLDATHDEQGNFINAQFANNQKLSKYALSSLNYPANLTVVNHYNYPLWSLLLARAIPNAALARQV